MKYIPTLKKIIPEGEPLPRFYGRSYRDWSDKEIIFVKVAYPIPINLIVAGVRSFLYWAEWRIRAPKPTWLEHRMAIVYDKGRDTRAEISRSDGYAEGYEEGKVDGIREVLGEIYSPDRLLKIAVSAFDNANAEAAINEMADAYEAGDPDGKLLKAAVASFRNALKPAKTNDNPPTN